MQAGGPKFCLEDTDAATPPTLVSMEIEIETYSFICTQQLKSCNIARSTGLSFLTEIQLHRRGRFEPPDSNLAQNIPVTYVVIQIDTEQTTHSFNLALNPRERNVLHHQEPDEELNPHKGSRGRNTLEIHIFLFGRTRTNLR